MKRIDSAENINALLEIIQSNPSNLVLFLGSGITKNPKMNEQKPSWNELLVELSGMLRNNQLIDDGLFSAVKVLVQKGMYDDAANILWDGKTEEASFRFIRKRLEYKRDDISETLNHLCSYNWSKVITTNFDNCIDTAFSNNGYAREVILGRDSADVYNALCSVGDRKVTIKLHGSTSVKGSIIFSGNQYVSALQNSSYRRMLECLLTRPILFIGYSLDDYDLSPILRELSEITRRGNENLFAFMSSKRMNNAQFFENLNVRPIWYNGSRKEGEGSLSDLIGMIIDSTKRPHEKASRADFEASHDTFVIDVPRILSKKKEYGGIQEEVHGVQSYVKRERIDIQRQFGRGSHEEGLQGKSNGMQVVRRERDVAKIIEILEQNRVALLLGDKSSGKTVLSKLVAFGFRQKNGGEVRYIDISSFPNHEFDLSPLLSFLRELPQGTLLIVDNCYRNPRVADAIYRGVLKVKHNVLLASSDLYESFIGQEEQCIIREIHKKRTHLLFRVDAGDIVDDVLEELGPEMVKSWNNMLLRSDPMLLEYKSDLSVLPFLLASRVDNKIDEKALWDSIYVDLHMMNNQIPGAMQIVLFIAFLYQYDIPVSSEFLISSSSPPEKTQFIISEMISRGYINKIKRSDNITLASSSLAKFYVCAFEKKFIKHTLFLSKEDFLVMVVEKYLEFAPDELMNVLTYMWMYHAVLKRILNTSVVKALLKQYFNNENSPTHRISFLLSMIVRFQDIDTRQALAELIDVERAAKRCNKEKGLLNVCLFLDSIPWDTRYAYVIEESNKCILNDTGKGKTETNSIGMCYEHCEWDVQLARNSQQMNKPEDVLIKIQEIIRKYTPSIDLEDVGGFANIAFCSKSYDSGEIAVCGKSVFSSLSRKAKDIINNLDITEIAKKCNMETDTKKIAHILNIFARHDKAKAKKLLQKLDAQHLHKLLGQAPMDVLVFMLWTLKNIDQRNFNIQYWVPLCKNQDIQKKCSLSGWFE